MRYNIQCISEFKIYVIFVHTYFQASRASFEHIRLQNTSIQYDALTSVRDSFANIHFEGEKFESPIAYSFMYVTWEANKVRDKIQLKMLA